MRKLTEDELDEYRREAAEERYERERQRKRAINDGKHVLDPSREWDEEEGTA